jgi:uncharacterized protein YicC (UPF0701 family)
MASNFGLKSFFDMETATFKARLATFIHKAQEEADALRVKAALGRMEAADVLNELSKDANLGLHSLSHDLKHEGTEIAAIANDYLERIRLQLSLGKAEAGKVYDQRKEAIQKSIAELESWIKTDGFELPVDLRIRLENEMAKFHFKLDILRIRFELGKLEAREVIDEKREQFKKEFQEILSSVKTETALKKEELSDKLKLAYESLRKSIQS